MTATAPRPAGGQQLAEPCRCALCLALLAAAATAERLNRERRGTLTLVEGGKR